MIGWITEEEETFMLMAQSMGFSFDEYMEMIGKQTHVLTPNGKVERVR